MKVDSERVLIPPPTKPCAVTIPAKSPPVAFISVTLSRPPPACTTSTPVLVVLNLGELLKYNSTSLSASQTI